MDTSFNIVRSSIGVLLSRMTRVRREKREGLTVFLFHSVTQSPSRFETNHHLAVSPDLFQKQILWILQYYHPVRPADLKSDKTLPPNACLVTFDDGWAGAFEHALPYLEKQSVPSLIFLNTEPLDGTPLWAALAFWLQESYSEFGSWMTQRPIWSKTNPALSFTPALLERWEREMGPVDWEKVRNYQGSLATWKQVRQWDGHPLVFYGNHLFNHWNAATMTNEELGSAFHRNQEPIDRLRSGTKHFAFTFGTYLPHQPSFLLQCGASHIHLSGGGVNRLPLAEKGLSRINISPWDDRPSRLHWQTTRRHLEHILGESLYGTIRGCVKGIR